MKDQIRALLLSLKDQQADVIGFKSVMRDGPYLLVEGTRNKRLSLDQAITKLLAQSKSALQGDDRLRV